MSKSSTDGLAHALREIERDPQGGSIELAHKAIMALFQAHKTGDHAKLDRQWLAWARRARPEMRIFANLAREAAKSPGRVAWARKKSLPFWLITVLYNSVSSTIKAGTRAIKPGDRILVYSYSWTVVHLLTLGKHLKPEILVPKDRHSQRTGRLLAAEGLKVRTVPLESADPDKVMVSCDAYDDRGAILNATGTRAVAEWARKHRVPAYCIATWLKKSAAPLRTSRNSAFELVPASENLRLIGDVRE